MNTKKTMYWLIIIILLGTFIRFYNLGKESFWLDEGTTSMTLKKYSALQILKNVKEKGQILPDYYSYGKYSYDEDLPMYYLLLSNWAKVFGLNEFSLRFFSALFGTLALIAIFYLGRYLFNNEAGILAAFLAAINPTLLWYSQEARQYSYLLFMSLLSVIFLLKLLKQGKTKHFFGFLIVNAFIIYSHFPWVIFIAFEGFYAAYILYSDYISKKKFNTKVLAAFLIIGIMYLPIIGRAINSKTNTVDLYGRPDVGQLATFGVQLSSWLYPSEAMRQKFYDKTYNFTFFEWALLVSVLLTALITAIMFFNGILNSSLNNKSSVFLLIMFFFPIVFALSLSYIHPKITVFQLKQMIYIVPAYLMLASLGIAKLRIKNIIVVILFILSILPLYAYYANPDKQQFREAALFLPKDETIFVSMETAQVIFKYYYGEKSNVIGVVDLNDLKKYLGNKDSFWVLLTFTKYSDPKGSIKNYLNENYLLTETKNYFDIELLHYSVGSK